MKIKILNTNNIPLIKGKGAESKLSKFLNKKLKLNVSP